MAARLWGRDSELAAVDGWLAGGDGAGRRTLLLAGPAGIGKTALLDAVVHAAADARTVLAGRGIATGAAPPLSLWTQLLGDVEDSAPDRLALVGRIRAALAAHGPVLVAVDDVQWVDESSLRLLTLVLDGTVDVLLAASLRTSDALAGWTAAGADLLTTAPPLRLDLAPLDADAATGCLVSAAGVQPPVEVVEGALRLAAGNAFYLTELGRTWRATGALGVPAAVVDIVAGRVARLSVSAQEFLQAAAVLGEDADIAVVARLVGRSALECLPAVQEGLDAQLLVREGSSLRFAHALTRSALLSRLSLMQHVSLHQRATAAIETLYSDDLDAHAAELALHWSELAVAGEHERAAHWCRRAGDVALRALAFEDASRFYALALDCAGTAATAAMRAQLLRAKAEADLRAGRMDQAAAAAAGAFEAARSADDAGLLADVALTLDAIGSRAWDRAVRERCEVALSRVPDDDPALRARLLARLSNALMYDGDWAAAAEASAESLALARGSDDQEALIAACRARQLAMSGPDGHDERGELATTMCELGERCGRPEVEMWGRLWRIDWLWEVGDLAGVAIEVNRLAGVVDRVGGPLARWHLLVAQSVLLQAHGQLAEAKALVFAATDVLRSAGHPSWFGALMALLAAIGHHAGHEQVSTDPPAGTAQSEAGETRGQLFAYIGIAVALAENGRVAEALASYRVPGPPQTWDIPPFFELNAVAAGCIVALECGVTDDLPFYVERLERRRGRHLVGGAGVGNYLGPVELLLGRARCALGELDEAELDLLAARRACDTSGAPGFATECDVELARVQLAQGRPREAAALLAPALPKCDRLGMTRIAGIARALAVEAEAAATDAGTAGVAGAEAGHGLTGREREVAALVAAGASNREIAQALFLSERTAANHVQHVLTKLGFTRRSQVAAWWPKSEYATE